MQVANDPLFFIFALLAFLFSVVVHEMSHGFVANILGDPTARLAGRLTLNPIPHIDPIGSILVPLVLFMAGGPMFGWAKPVPYNPHNLRGKWGDAKVGAAGPLSNLFLAVFFGLILRFMFDGSPDSPIALLLGTIVFINILLAVFNLLPIPPLDGSKVLFSFLPYHMRHIQQFLEQYWLVLFLVVIFFAWGFISPIVELLFRLIVG